MSMLVGKCKKCGTTIELDVGDQTLDEVKQLLKRRVSFECPGNHVELCSAYPSYWFIDEWKRREGKAPTDEEFVAKLKETYIEVIDSDEMNGRNIITGFASGFPITSDGKAWDFRQSPSGKRYYFC